MKEKFFDEHSRINSKLLEEFRVPKPRTVLLINSIQLIDDYAKKVIELQQLTKNLRDPKENYLDYQDISLLTKAYIYKRIEFLMENMQPMDDVTLNEFNNLENLNNTLKQLYQYKTLDKNKIANLLIDIDKNISVIVSNYNEQSAKNPSDAASKEELLCVIYAMLTTFNSTLNKILTEAKQWSR